MNRVMHKKLSTAFFFVLVFCIATSAQQRVHGEVVEVVDGKNIVIEDKDKKRLAVQLQYIEIPDPQFPIWQTIKDHLQKLALGKIVEVEVTLADQKINIARVSVDGTDLSRQMLRDGAAWCYSSGGPDYAYNEISEYQTLENAAKSEKRGLWAVTGIKSTQELKLEKDAKAKEQERISEEDRLLKVRLKRAEDERRANENLQFWPDVPDNQSGGQSFISKEWEWVAGSAANRFYISRKRITKTPQGTFQTWLMAVPRTDTEAGKQGRQSYIASLALEIGSERADKFAYYLNLREYNCAEKETRDGRIIFYDIDGTVIRQLEGLKNWSPSAPDSLNGALLKAVCKQNR